MVWGYKKNSRITYKAGILIVVVDKFSGWARKINNKCNDTIKRLKCIGVKTEKEALEKAIELCNGKTMM